MTLIDRDLKHIWHPCSQMKDYERFRPIAIRSAYGSYLELQDGTKIIDAISSWWCKSLGHGHPRLRAALLSQLERYEHVIAANTCQEVLVALSHKLSLLCLGLDRIFYASEGASAVEIAIKMSLQSRTITGDKRHNIMALKNAYHGETLLALSLSDVELYKRPFQHWLLPVLFLQGIPYVTAKTDPVWKDCKMNWQDLEKQLDQYADTLSAIIVEPLVQGAAGMLLYSQDFLKRLRSWTLKHNVHLIADEIMTGFGRTGYPLACQHAGIKPDFICLGKGLTAGWLPMSAVVTSTPIYQLFYDDYNKGKSFLHSHTFSGNALAAAVALETLKILEEEQIYKKVRNEEALLKHLMLGVAKQTGRLENVRVIGAIAAADLKLNGKQKLQRYGYKIFQQAVKFGALLRPLGNTIYWLPPLNASSETLFELAEITTRAIQEELS